jgi:hypothetical protein
MGGFAGHGLPSVPKVGCSKGGGPDLCKLVCLIRDAGFAECDRLDLGGGDVKRTGLGERSAYTGK